MITRQPRLTIQDIPELPGYISVAGVADKYGMNKGAIYHMIYSARKFKTVFRVAGGDSQRPMLLLAANEVEALFGDRVVRPRPSASLAALKSEWNKRVKQWGVDTGWTETPIRVSGRPHLILENAYLEAHPDDPRPGSE